MRYWVASSGSKSRYLTWASCLARWSWPAASCGTVLNMGTMRPNMTLERRAEMAGKAATYRREAQAALAGFHEPQLRAARR